MYKTENMSRAETKIQASGKKSYYFHEAIRCIDTYADKKQCHGAVLVKGNKIVARGRNQSRNRIMKNNVCSTHAEIDCLNNLMSTERYRYLKRRVLYDKGQCHRYEKDGHIHCS